MNRTNVVTIIAVKDTTGRVHSFKTSFTLPEANYRQPEELTRLQWYDWEDEVCLFATRKVPTWQHLKFQVNDNKACTIVVSREHYQ